MKKVLLVLILALTIALFAEESEIAQEEQITQEIQEDIDEAMAENADAMDEIKDVAGIEVNYSSNQSNKAFMGVTSTDLCMSKMQELGYNKMYGVLITGVTANSAADFFRLGKDDIIMKIGKYKVTNSKEFSKILSFYRAGDQAIIKIFRLGKEMEIDFVFGSRNSKLIKENNKIILVDRSSKPDTPKGKKRLSGGTGGGSWLPIWFNGDFDDINSVLSSNGLDDLANIEIMDKKGILLHGGAGKGNVGKNWMLGGMGAGYSYTTSRKTDNGDTRKINVEVGYWGITLDKRHSFTKKITVAAGFMIGGAHQSVKLTQTDADFNWDFTDESEVANSSILSMRKDYIIFQPKAVAMYRILDWLAIRAEGGYIMSHALESGWKAKMGGNDYTVNDSPNSPFDGITFTIGPWFGF
jgi:hypothetical protein